MNEVFRSHLRKFILVFFDDILVYSSNMSAHVEHLKVAFQLLQHNQLRVNKKKWSFGQSQLEYLGHLISKKKVEADPSKVASIVEWVVPINAKSLRTFLGLTGYYKKFVKGYGKIAAPLTMLL